MPGRDTSAARPAAARARRATTGSNAATPRPRRAARLGLHPAPGWLDPLLPHFADPELDAIAPRIVAQQRDRRHRPLRGRALAARPRPAPRARDPARAACRSCPARRSSSAGTCASTDPAAAARTSTSSGAPATSATSPRARSRTPTARPPEPGSPGASTTAAPPRRWPSATPARPARSHVSPWTTAAWAALATKRPKTALAITAAARRRCSRARSRRRPPPNSPASARCVPARCSPTRCAASTGRSRSLKPEACSRRRARSPHPLKLADDLAYGAGRLDRLRAAPHARSAAAVPRLAAGTPYCRAVGAIARLATGRRSKWVVIAAWVVAAARRVPVPVQAPDARLRRERRVREPRRRVDAGRGPDRAALPRRRGHDHAGALHPRRPVHAAGRRSASPPTPRSCAKRDAGRAVITAVQLGCGELPELTPPPSSRHRIRVR